MIKKLEIKNFKGIGDPGVEIEFKPITLLFGPNNAGKSTIIQALHYLKEIFERKNFDPINTQAGGKAIDLGGFKSLVNNQDYQNKSITFRIDLTPNVITDFEVVSANAKWDPLFDYTKMEKEYREYDSYIGRILDYNEESSIKIKISWHPLLKRAEVTEFSILLDGEDFIKIDESRSTDAFIYFRLAEINFENALIKKVFEKEDLELYKNLIAIEDNKIGVEIENLSYAIPDWKNDFNYPDDFLLIFKEEGEWGIKALKFLKIIKSIINNIGVQLSEELNEIRYIGPLREIPPRVFISHPKAEEERWANGLAAWDAIYNGYPKVDLINKWMSKLGTGYYLQLLEFKELPLENLKNFKDKDYLYDFLNEIKSTIDSRISDVDKIKFDLERKTLKIFTEAQKRIDQRYEELLGPSQKLRNFLPSIIGAGIGALAGPAGMLAGALSGLMTSYMKNDISRKEFEKGVREHLEKVFKEEEEKFLEIIIEIEDANKVTEAKLNQLIREFREEVQFKLADTLENFKNEIEKIDKSIEVFRKEIIPLQQDLNLYKVVYNLPTKKRLYLFDSDKKINIQPHDVGVGISQVVPVVVGSLMQSNSILAIEQPELHIHPKMQVELADLFIDQINKNKNILFLIETHSEHLMLRFLRRIEENTKNKLDKTLRLKPDSINVYWCESTQEGLKVELLPIDESGEFTRKWPKGFFEERAEELFPNE